jgi:hypothetical protein
VTPVLAASPIRWAAGPLRFELTSDDPGVRTLATAVFRPWAVQDDQESSRAWRVDRLNGNGIETTWRVRSSAGTDIRVPSAARAVSAVEYGAVSAIVGSSVVIVHGALVAWNGRGVLLAGRGEAGKSTLACALWTRGAALLGDDVTLVDPSSSEARPAPRRVSVRAASRALLGADFFARTMRGPSSVALPDSHMFHPDEIEPCPRSAAVRLAAIALLSRRGGAAAPACAEPIPAAHALLALLPYTNLRSGRTLGDAIRILTPLADRVPAYDLGRGPLADMASVVEDLVGTRRATERV